MGGSPCGTRIRTWLHVQEGLLVAGTQSLASVDSTLRLGASSREQTLQLLLARSCLPAPAGSAGLRPAAWQCKVVPTAS